MVRSHNAKSTIRIFEYIGKHVLYCWIAVFAYILVLHQILDQNLVFISCLSFCLEGMVCCILPRRMSDFYNFLTCNQSLGCWLYWGRWRSQAIVLDTTTESGHTVWTLCASIFSVTVYKCKACVTSVIESSLSHFVIKGERKIYIICM